MTLLIGSYNILHGRDYPYYLQTKEERIDLAQTASAIRDLKLDICGLNEVRNQENVAGLCHQAKEIARELGYYYAFGKAINHRGGEYGNALVSRYPILSTKVIPIVVPAEERIEGQAYEDRALLCAEILVDGQKITVLVSHFGLNADEMEKAVAVVRDVAAGCDTPLMLMGDLNFKPDSPFYDALCGIFRDTAAIGEDPFHTFPSQKPDRKIDYVFISDAWETVDAYVPNVQYSDHRPYVTELKLK